jgi:hypothetical protein
LRILLDAWSALTSFIAARRSGGKAVRPKSGWETFWRNLHLLIVKPQKINIH